MPAGAAAAIHALTIAFSPTPACGPTSVLRAGSLSAALAAAGWKGIEEQALELPFPWPGPATELCTHFFEVAAPFRPVLASLGPEKAEDALAQVVAALRRDEVNGHIEMNAQLVVVAAAR